ncbi:MAG TPA: CPBP family intramembrane glutamic endopeptidase [Planctomycetaceae bacterium]|nr:CPBP family intramembrane glutamic endopeptidase [Planctomycetaceae bacterium]
MKGRLLPPIKEADEYWVLARQPLHCLLFLLPLLATYEVGVCLAAGAGNDAARNGADYWMRIGLKLAGLQHPFLLPLGVIGLLAIWQIAGHYQWKPSAATLFGMLAESVLFGVCLVILGQLQDLAFRTQLAQGAPAQRVLLEGISTQPGVLPRAVSYVGAGVYEEVLFRLCLLPILYGLFRTILIPRQAAIVLSVLATSLLFSAAHYVGPAADQFAPFSFVFRATAGLVFAMLFVFRGFGITVGSHAAYDLLVGILIPAFGS